MRVTVKTEYEINGDEVWRIFNERLERLAGEAFFRGDVLYENDEHYHGSITDSPVKNPSEVLKAAVRLRDALKKQERKRYEEEMARQLEQAKRVVAASKNKKRS